MSIFDKLRQGTAGAVKATVQSAGTKQQTFTFATLPESLAQLQALPEAALTDPFQTAALTVCALCAYAADKNVGKEMLDWLRGPRPLSPYDISFLSATKHFYFAVSLRPCWIRPFFRLPIETCPLFPIHKKPARIFRPGRLLFSILVTPRTSACTRRTVPCIRRCPHGFRAAFRACSCCGASRQ